MNPSTRSMCVFAVYLSLMGALCTFYPRAFLWFGFKSASGPWVRILGLVLMGVASFYGAAIRERAVNFYRWTVYARLPLLPAFAVLVGLGIAPPILILIGLWDAGCGVWTGLALRREAIPTPVRAD